MNCTIPIEPKSLALRLTMFYYYSMNYDVTIWEDSSWMLEWRKKE